LSTWNLFGLQSGQRESAPMLKWPEQGMGDIIIFLQQTNEIMFVKACFSNVVTFCNIMKRETLLYTLLDVGYQWLTGGTQ
jgi:hypothetical protein